MSSIKIRFEVRPSWILELKELKRCFQWEERSLWIVDNSKWWFYILIYFLKYFYNLASTKMNIASATIQTCWFHDHQNIMMIVANRCNYMEIRKLFRINLKCERTTTIWRWIDHDAIHSFHQLCRLSR